MPTAPVERKVTVAAAAAYLGSTGLLAALTAVQDQPGLVGFLPAWLAPFVLPVVPAAVTFVAGYQARHTPRTGPEAG
jgi:hypothetical protein